MIYIMVGSLKTSIMIIIVFEQLSRDKSDIRLMIIISFLPILLWSCHAWHILVHYSKCSTTKQTESGLDTEANLSL